MTRLSQFYTQSISIDLPDLLPGEQYINTQPSTVRLSDGTTVIFIDIIDTSDAETAVTKDTFAMRLDALGQPETTWRKILDGQSTFQSKYEADDEGGFSVLSQAGTGNGGFVNQIAKFSSSLQQIGGDVIDINGSNGGYDPASFIEIGGNFYLLEDDSFGSVSPVPLTTDTTLDEFETLNIIQYNPDDGSFIKTQVINGIQSGLAFERDENDEIQSAVQVAGITSARIFENEVTGTGYIITSIEEPVLGQGIVPGTTDVVGTEMRHELRVFNGDTGFRLETPQDFDPVGIDMVIFDIISLPEGGFAMMFGDHDGNGTFAVRLDAAFTQVSPIATISLQGQSNFSGLYLTDHGKLIASVNSLETVLDPETMAVDLGHVGNYVAPFDFADTSRPGQFFSAQSNEMNVVHIGDGRFGKFEVEDGGGRLELTIRDTRAGLTEFTSQAQQTGGADDVVGTVFDDTMFDGNGADVFMGWNGDDTFLGQFRDTDAYYGQDDRGTVDNGRDTLSYAGSGAPFGLSGAPVFDLDLDEVRFLRTIQIGQFTSTITVTSTFDGIEEFIGSALDEEFQFRDLPFIPVDLDGGGGINTLVHKSAPDSIEVNFLAGNITYEFIAASNNYRFENFSNFTGGSGREVVIGDNSANVISTGGGNDEIDGNGGNDMINGGTGEDVMRGGQGDDGYTVDNISDSVIEEAGEGYDTVTSFISLTIPVNVESLVLAGTANINAMGSAGSEQLTGNSGNNTLEGGEGNDTMTGGNGMDLINGGGGFDTVDYSQETGTQGVNIDLRTNSGTDTFGSTDTLDSIERVIGSSNNDIIFGSAAGGQVLMGMAGEDQLIGMGGGDELHGGADNDYYVIENAADTVIELVGEGDDILDTFISYNVPVNVEVLRMQGTADLESNGSASRDIIQGNSGNNYINGAGGIDLMIGGDGNDVYSIDNSQDTVIEAVGGGDDVIYTSVDYVLLGDQEIETAILTENAVILRGDDSNNQLIGNDFVNVLEGKGGTDYLLGLGGDDIFQVSKEANATDLDVFGDFEGAGVIGGDRIALSAAEWGMDGIVYQVSQTSFIVATAQNTNQQQFQIANLTAAQTDLIAGDDYYFG